MAKTRSTLFQQLQEESAAQASSGGNWRQSELVRLMIIIATPILCALFFPSLSHIIFGTSKSLLLSEGQVWQQQTLVAETTFPIRKDASEIQAEMWDAVERTPPVFSPLRSSRVSVAPTLNAAEAYLMKGIDNTDAEIRRQLRELVKECTALQMTDVELSAIKTNNILVAESGTVLRSLPTSELLDSSRLRTRVESALTPPISAATRELVQRRLLELVRPGLIRNEERSKILQDAAVASVSRTRGIVRKGEVVISKGEVLTPTNISKLANYGYVQDESVGSASNGAFIAGSLLHAMLVYSLLVLFVYFLRKKIYNDNLQLISLSALIFSSALFSWATLLLPREFSVEFLVLIPACAMVAAIYFDSRTGFIVTVTSSLMYAAVRSNDSDGAFALIIAGTLGAYSVRDLRTRTQLFRSIGFILIGFVLVITAMVLEQGGSIAEQWRAYSWAVVNAVVSPLLTFAVIAITERYFGVMTDLTLREYDNVNHPLLMQMSEKAPGTYQHTLAIAHLVESAAHSVEASPLLARVGAYFHDIGKIAKSEYFIENQIEIDNKHDHLTPKKSAAIIRNHVAEGIEIAREYGLPEKIIDFIPMHHGTGLIKHFYAKAKEDADESGADEIQEESFRYPGPKPQTKETALVMLADGVEAVSRTVDDREALEIAVDGIFKEKILDGQLDECDLTMRDLAAIKESFVRNLIGAHHQRMVYKELPKDEASQR